MDQSLRLLVAKDWGGFIRLGQAIEWFSSRDKASKAISRLEMEGLAFPVAAGKYAVPDPDEILTALAQSDARERLRGWLWKWLKMASRRNLLPRGPRWNEAMFLNPAIEEFTRLVWDGPSLLVPIEENVPHLERINQRVPIVVMDYSGAVTNKRMGSYSVPLPSKAEVARLLLAHSNPRLKEAGSQIRLPDGEAEAMRLRLSLTEAPLSFPDPNARLPRGPPFRFRTYAPQSWVMRDLSYRLSGQLGG